MHRDLYSAFLAKCVDIETSSLDIARAKQLWPGLEPVLSEAVSRVYQSAIGRNTVPSSFGLTAKGLPKAPACCEETQSLDQRQSGSPVKPVATVTEAMDDVIRSSEDENHGEVI